ncbi:MAG: FAD-dependent oxidoreductase [Rhodobacteraceae bacterium PARR1]|nr:MAG: FAD-dependent oxidoreductase [Rhodobacteraceae bacterium PARR1]
MTPFPISASTPIRHPGPPPAACDVVILGGGVAGVMTAYFLAERGVKVVLCEKGRIAGEQSSRNWGWIRQQGRHPAELPIMIEANRLWQSFAQTMPGLGFRQEGVLYLALTEAEMAGFDGWMTHARTHGLDSRLLGAEGVQVRLSGSRAPWVGGMLTPSDARAEPWVAVPLLAQAAVQRGAVLVEHCAVRRLDIAAGRVVGVITEQGRIACDQVLVAGGAWSSLFLRAHGVTIPQLSVLSSVAATTPMPEVFAGNACDNDFAFRRRQDGGYSLAPGYTHDFFIGPDAFRHFGVYLPTLKQDWRATKFHALAPRHFPDAWGTARRWSGDEVSPFERQRVLNPAPNLKALSRVQDAFASAFPQAGRPVLSHAWGGMIDTMPDVIPVIDRDGAIPGLTIATGLSGHGFGIGPAFGRILADLMTGNDPGHDLHPFRLSRFSDGSVIAPSTPL